MSAHLFTCDLCGRVDSVAAKCELFARYRTPEVKDVCGKCEEEIRRTWRKIARITDGLCSTLTRRAIRVMRRRKREAPSRGRIPELPEIPAPPDPPFAERGR